MRFQKFIQIIMFSALLTAISACTAVTATVENDASLPFVELQGYKFHVRTFGDKNLPPLIVVHGGPGGDSKYLYPLQSLAKSHHVVFYDQRGTGLSPRVDKQSSTLQSSLEDLHLIVNHFGNNKPVRILGHSWGGMLVMGYLGQHPERISHAVVVEPGILNAQSAQDFVTRFKASQSWLDAMPMLKYILATPFISSHDGHERFDYVMTRLMNRAKPGGPYQCEGESMPDNAFERAGFDAFNNMLKPVLDKPEMFTKNLLRNIESYKGELLMLSSSCSFIGFDYQNEFHMPHLPAQTKHLKANNMGHNMLTLNADWSTQQLQQFFQ